MNLYDETVEALGEAGKTADDVAWVGSWDVLLDTESFWDRARQTDYDDGWGRQEVPLDLVVVLRDGSWLEREEYDGREEWAYRSTPARPASPPVPCAALCVGDAGVGGWVTLREMLDATRAGGDGE